MDHLLPQSPDTLVLVLPRLARGCCHARFACKRAFLAYTRHFDFSSTLVRCYKRSPRADGCARDATV